MRLREANLDAQQLQPFFLQTLGSTVMAVVSVCVHMGVVLSTWNLLVHRTWRVLTQSYRLLYSCEQTLVQKRKEAWCKAEVEHVHTPADAPCVSDWLLLMWRAGTKEQTSRIKGKRKTHIKDSSYLDGAFPDRDLSFSRKVVPSFSRRPPPSGCDSAENT